MWSCLFLSQGSDYVRCSDIFLKPPLYSCAEPVGERKRESGSADFESSSINRNERTKAASAKKLSENSSFFEARPDHTFHRVSNSRTKNVIKTSMVNRRTFRLKNCEMFSREASEYTYLQLHLSPFLGFLPPIILCWYFDKKICSSFPFL